MTDVLQRFPSASDLVSDISDEATIYTGVLDILTQFQRKPIEAGIKTYSLIFDHMGLRFSDLPALLVALNSKFTIGISISEIENCSTVANVFHTVERRIATSTAGVLAGSGGPQVVVPPTTYTAPDAAVVPPSIVGGVKYSYTVPATGGKKPYILDVYSGSLPDGIAINGLTVSGTPIGPITAFRLRLTDALKQVITASVGDSGWVAGVGTGAPSTGGGGTGSGGTTPTPKSYTNSAGEAYTDSAGNAYTAS